LPKPFALLKDVDVARRTVTLRMEGEKTDTVWPLEPDAEVKVKGWWGRLDQFQAGARVWVWLKLDRNKLPVSVVMLADEMTEFDCHGILAAKKTAPPSKVFEAAAIETQRQEQKAWLRQRWLKEGLPGTLTFHHIFSGELELMLDHEAMRWGRSLKPGAAVELNVDPPIKAVVKEVSPWRERTMVRLVVGELESADLKLGQRLGLKTAPPDKAVDESPFPADLDSPRTGAARVEWFLANIYCVCGINKDTCTGQFYTLASCNPNGCGMPNHMRKQLAKWVDQGLTDRQIFDTLMKENGEWLLRPHLSP
jgi:hypothetical protein